MYLLLAFAMLILLLVHIEEKDKPLRAVREDNAGETDWIDALELFDAAADDFV